MPLPLLVPIVMGGAALLGVGKGVKAAVDSSDADDVNDEAESIVYSSNRNLEKSKLACNNSLEKFGLKKLQAYEKNLQRFVCNYSKLKNVNLSESKGLSELRNPDFSQEAVKEMEKSCNLAMEALSGGATALGGGALVAFGAYNGTMLLASAGTGTAISTLSGAAATNATLAWIGGGTLSAGGLGVAGGTMVLGAMVAGPALLIFGSILGAKAEKKLSEARANRQKAKLYRDEVDLVVSKLDQITRVTQFASSSLSRLRTCSRRANNKMEEVIAENGVNWSSYSKEAKEIVLQAVKCAQLIKVFVDTPLLDEDGILDARAEGEFAGLAKQID
ncbi:hypothetical protein JCM16814_34250 [Desulfobaculum senezii]